MSVEAKTKRIVTEAHTTDVIVEPLTPDEIKPLLDSDGRGTFVVLVPMNDIVAAWGLDSFNDVVEERLLEQGVMSDITYEAVGVFKGDILLKVKAEFMIDY